jgi:hypothetical protein
MPSIDLIPSQGWDVHLPTRFDSSGISALTPFHFVQRPALPGYGLPYAVTAPANSTFRSCNRPISSQSAEDASHQSLQPTYCQRAPDDSTMFLSRQFTLSSAAALFLAPATTPKRCFGHMVPLWCSLTAETARSPQVPVRLTPYESAAASTYIAPKDCA